jgi:succinoglycan biosynthesis transport protein ExoP
MEPLPRFASYTDDVPATAWHRSVRARLFAITFLVTLALGIGWTLLQPVVYRSSATVLMSAPSAIDAAIEEANIQSVAIQSRILLGGDVTRNLLQEIGAGQSAALDAQYLRDVLRVEAVADTNLVEMVAEGEDAELLPDLVNSWIDVYLAIRAASVQNTQQQTLGVVQDQMAGLSQRVDDARDALARYRDEHRITSVERQQNEELAQLDGLNTALNSAVRAEVKTKAKLQALREAIASGKNVVPPSERDSVASMETELFQLRTRMTRLSKTYTENYIRNQPSTREIPQRIAELEAALETERAKGQSLILAQAEQAHASALQTVADLREKLAVQEERAAQFTTIYNKHEALAEDLEELEALYRDTQSRLVQVEVNQVEKYPQVEVIDRPAEESERVGPDYLLLLGGSFGAALGMGILSVWLYGFLGHRPAKPAFVTLSGVHMYPQDMQHIGYAAPSAARISQANPNLLDRQKGEQSGDEPLPTEGDTEPPTNPPNKDE